MTHFIVVALGTLILGAVAFLLLGWGFQAFGCGWCRFQIGLAARRARLEIDAHLDAGASTGLPTRMPSRAHVLARRSPLAHRTYRRLRRTARRVVPSGLSRPGGWRG